MSEPLPSLLIPGLLCTARLYAEQIPVLWRYGPVMVADHRRDDTMAAIVARILAAAPPRFALVGLSMGGHLALEVMRQAPDRVARLALLDTSARGDTPEITERRQRQVELAQNGRLGEVVDQQLPLFVHRDRQGDASLAGIVRAMTDETGVEAFVRQQRALMGRADLRPSLAAIRCATVVLVGDGDELTPPSFAREIAGGIAGARLVVVPASGHLSTLEQPAAVNAALVEWMAA
jgi:pimeloyl-ACP methyl ester carboxylesterase